MMNAVSVSNKEHETIDRIAEELNTVIVFSDRRRIAEILRDHALSYVVNGEDHNDPKVFEVQ